MSPFSFKLGAALAAAAALALPAPASATHARMVWYHWTSATRPAPAERFGGTAVVGLESMADLGALRAAYSFTRVRAMPQLRAVEVRVGRTQLRRLLARGPNDQRIRYVSPVGRPRHTLAMPNDPLLTTMDPGTARPYEWQFAAAHVDRALELSPGSPSVVVGTIDSGIADVPDLAGKIDGRWGFADGATEPTSGPAGIDEKGHGTAVASLIAANVDDGFGMAGFGGASHVISFRVENRGFTDSAIAAGLVKLDALGVKVINMSFGANAPSRPILLDAIHKVAADGVLLVAASGNNHGFVAHPAADLQPAGGGRGYGLAVGASDAGDRLAPFSNVGSHLSLVAPGVFGGACSGVLVAMHSASLLEGTCYPGWTLGSAEASYAYVAGTSFAAPEVAGVAALIWAARPELKNYEVADIIKQTARRAPGAGWTRELGCGVLDAGAALEVATGVTSPVAAGSGDACSAGAAAPAAWPTLVRPSVHALPAAGVRGRLTTLRYDAGEDTYDVTATLVVRRGGEVVARQSRPGASLAPGERYSFSWRAPTARAALTFCVSVTNRQGVRSAPSCAPISLR
jgi:subtilisin family serine protease